MSSGLGGRRFALVAPNYYPETCGVGDYSMRLGRELTRRGASVAVFTHLPAELHPEAPTVEVHGSNGRAPLRILDGLRGAIAAFAPTDLVVQYTAHMLLSSRFGSPAIPLLLAEMSGRVRRTVIFHELYYAWYWRPDLAVADLLQRWQCCATLGATDRVFVTTIARKRQVDALLRHMAGPRREAGIMFVGANAEPIPRRPLASRSGRRRLGVFSMMGRTRRFDVMIDAFTLINARHPETELVLIGDLARHETLFRELKQRIASSPASGSIRLTGALPLARVAEEVASLDVYVLPDEDGASTRSGTLPVAFGSGVPVVAPRGAGAASDIFIQGENIVYTDELSAEALSAASIHLLEDAQVARTVGAGGRALYDRCLSWPSIVDQFLAS